MKSSIKTFIFLLIIAGAACSRKATDYRAFLDGKEIVYPGTVTDVSALPGKLRLELQWHPSPDPSVTKYVVYWNNYADSLIVPATSHDPQDTVKCIVSNLQEYTYTFFINSYDSAGNKSITQEVDNAKAYGSIYQNNLFNRALNTDLYNGYALLNDTTVIVYFLTPDTVNVTTHIKYTNNQNTISDAYLAPDSPSIILHNFKYGTGISFQSSYQPSSDAIDTFYVNRYDSLNNIVYRLVECSKSLFKAANLPHDIHDNYYGTHIESIWDGSTSIKGYTGDIHGAFCSDGLEPLANHFSIDLGATYKNIARIQEIGRNCCDNPIDFEVWGIADTTNAVSQLAGNDPNWKADIQSKGWTLLTEVSRNDDGSAPVTADFIDNPPPVRFIMVRVLKTAGGGSGTNLSQVTFWAKQ